MDIDEWVLGTGRTLGSSLEDAIKTSTVARVAIHGKSLEPFAMWGVGPDLEDPRVGIVWALGTDAMATAGRALQMHWKEEMVLLDAGHSLLAAAVMERNKQHVKWLSAIGFTKSGTIRRPGAVAFTLYTRIPA